MKTGGIFLLAVTACLVIAVAVQAKVIDCTVVSAQKDTVVLDCGNKAGNLETGNKVKVRSISRKRAPLMGC